MQNSILILIERVETIRSQVAQLLQTNRKPPAPKVLFLRNMLASALHKLNTFGQRYSAVQVNYTVKLGNIYEERIIYYTDITQQEAIDYTRFKSTLEITYIEAINLPIGKPIEL